MKPSLIKLKLSFLFLLAACLAGTIAFPQSISNISWPREIPLSNGGLITVYQPQPESFSGNKVSARAAVSVRQTAKDEPIFGAVWAEGLLQTDKDNRTATLESLTITDAKFPNLSDSSVLLNLRQTLEEEIPNWNMVISLDALIASLDQGGAQGASDLKNDPPEIIYATQPSALVLIDGNPIVAMDNDLKMERVNNSPFLIVKNPDDKKYYLYGGKFWYTSSSITEGWKSIASLPNRIKALDDQIKKQEKEDAEKNKDQAAAKKEDPVSPPALIVRTAPAELVQSNGPAEFKSVEGTSLLYMSNTDNDVFKDINTQDNYVLLSGRWYKSKSLNGPWTYVPSDQLPADYAKIPEGSDKDGVLANVAGTDEAREAILDASIPQTAKVDRKTATTKVEYDGDPNFQSIDGTDLQYADNTSATVILENAKYYAVENGVWFESNSPNGPWRVSDTRPNDVEKIPPSNPCYNTRYVYIYETTPDYIYVGYTPGYLNCYIYGPTVVYGTGWYYRPWWRRYYYPRPLTWGFGMHYNPWRGFSMGVWFNFGFFNYVSWNRPWGGWHGGWFGPPAYRPPYRPPYRPGGGGYYGSNRPGRPRPANYGTNRPSRINLYNNQRGITTRDVNRRPGGAVITRPGTRPATGTPGTRPVTDNNNRLPATRPGTGNSDNRLPATRPGNPDNGSTRPAPANPGNRLPSTGNPANPGNRLPADNNTNPGNRLPATRPAPSVTPQPRPSRQPNNVFADRQGNVYQRDNQGTWNQRNNQNRTWQPTTQPPANINRESQMRDRGNMRTNNFNQQSRPAPAPSARPAGGGASRGVRR